MNTLQKYTFNVYIWSSKHNVIFYRFRGKIYLSLIVNDQLNRCWPPILEVVFRLKYSE